VVALMRFMPAADLSTYDDVNPPIGSRK